MIHYYLRSSCSSGRPGRKNYKSYHRWSQGPSFLLQGPESWPENPSADHLSNASELHNSVFCGATSVVSCQPTSDHKPYSSWKELLEVTVQELHGAAESDGHPTAKDYRQAERLILQRALMDSFPREYNLLRAVSSSSRLRTLSPEFDESGELICVAGWLHQAEDLESTALHPVILDPSHQATRLLIQDFDNQLHHPTRTGMDCFGPFEVKVGQHRKKREGIIFKCLTTRAVHLDLLTAIDTDAFLMALHHFIAHRGTPAELFSDQGTNFKGGERGVWEREIRSVKSALYATVGAKPVAKEVLHTVLTEVEGILNSKPLGYVSSDASDPDPVTPNVLLMGRPITWECCRWKHSQVLADHFWTRFIRLYACQRNKELEECIEAQKRQIKELEEKGVSFRKFQPQDQTLMEEICPRDIRRPAGDVSMMSERRHSQEDDCSSLLSRLGSDSPRPRMKYGGMFCSVEGAFENKTLNFESFSPQTQRRRAARSHGDGRDGGEAAKGQTVVFPSGHARENYGKKELCNEFENSSSVKLNSRSVVEKTFSLPPPPAAYNGESPWRSLPVVEPEQRRRRRGKEGREAGVLVRLRKHENRPPLPSILLANVQSLDNKLDELRSRMAFQQDIKNCNVLVFTETWLDPFDPGLRQCSRGTLHSPTGPDN
ncbi:hypothetical protein L3Q82_000887 [Scortum barcoo]|uniref:Uncharacterized protein n=1 Tax=Scortum barcoo TaxID=214431 RepID=A0ACB8WAI3_9TELE|nr:hypothetical protein L3Q82_000887 [Scortum barcoo]